MWHDVAWEDYLSWQKEDKKTLKRIHLLLTDIDRHGNKGIGEPEALKYDLSGWWSRRIDKKNRLIYRLNEDFTVCEILSCKDHY